MDTEKIEPKNNNDDDSLIEKNAEIKEYLNYDPNKDDGLHVCLDCKQKFKDSFMMDKFGYAVCNSCRRENNHSLISKTEAKERYLLKDFDFDFREPILSFIMKANPHNPGWGSMKLYCEAQVAQRALSIWETEEKLEAERTRRDTEKAERKLKLAQSKLEREKRKEKAAAKTRQRCANLTAGIGRAGASSSSNSVINSATHQHEFSSNEHDYIRVDDVENEDDDVTIFKRKCLHCDYWQTFEQM